MDKRIKHQNWYVMTFRARLFLLFCSAMSYFPLILGFSFFYYNYFSDTKGRSSKIDHFYLASLELQYPKFCYSHLFFESNFVLA